LLHAFIAILRAGFPFVAVRAVLRNIRLADRRQIWSPSGGPADCEGAMDKPTRSAAGAARPMATVATPAAVTATVNATTSLRTLIVILLPSADSIALQARAPNTPCRSLSIRG
jgi:hypothetical protein